MARRYYTQRAFLLEVLIVLWTLKLNQRFDLGDSIFYGLPLLL